LFGEDPETEVSFRKDKEVPFVLDSIIESADAIDPAFLSFFFFLRLPINLEKRLEESSCPSSPLVDGRFSGVDSIEERPLLRIEPALLSGSCRFCLENTFLMPEGCGEESWAPSMVWSQARLRLGQNTKTEMNSRTAPTQFPCTDIES
jgi:hypothetical protein